MVPPLAAFEAAVGTANYSSTNTPPFGTFIYYIFRLTDYAPSSGIDVMVRGPAGWNNGNTLTLRTPWLAGRKGEWWAWWAFGTGTAGCDGVTRFDCPAVSGDYTIEATVDGIQRTVRVTVDATRFLARPPSVQVTASSTTRVDVNWGEVSGAQAYQVVVRENSPPTFPIAGSQSARRPPASVQGLALDPSAQYVVDVRAFSFETWANPLPPLPSQVNWSRIRSAAFTPGGTTAGAAATAVPERGGDVEYGRLK